MSCDSRAPGKQGSKGGFRGGRDSGWWEVAVEKRGKSWGAGEDELALMWVLEAGSPR